VLLLHAASLCRQLGLAKGLETSVAFGYSFRVNMKNQIRYGFRRGTWQNARIKPCSPFPFTVQTKG
jgi:hypothetical protein